MTDSKRGKHNPYLYPGLTSQAGQFPYCLPSHHIPTTQYILVPHSPLNTEETAQFRVLPAALEDVLTILRRRLISSPNYQIANTVRRWLSAIDVVQRNESVWFLLFRRLLGSHK